MGLFPPGICSILFSLQKYIWQALLEEIWQPKICQGQASLLEKTSFRKFEYTRQARVVKKKKKMNTKQKQRWNGERVLGCSVGDGLRYIRCREEPLTAMHQLIFSPINHQHLGMSLTIRLLLSSDLLQPPVTIHLFSAHTFLAVCFVSHRPDCNSNWMGGGRAGQRSYKNYGFISNSKN